MSFNKSINSIPEIDEEEELRNSTMTSSESITSSCISESEEKDSPKYESLQVKVIENTPTLIETLLSQYLRRPLRVFFIVDTSETCFVVLVPRTSSWKEFLQLCSTKSGKEIETVFHKNSNAELKNVEELRDDDILFMKSPTKKRAPKLTSVIVIKKQSKSASKFQKKSLKPQLLKNAKQKTKSSSLNNTNSFLHFISNLESSSKEKKMMRRSLSSFYTNNSIKDLQSTILDIRKIDKSIPIKKNFIVMNYHTGTSIKRSTYPTKHLLREMKRSKSVPESLLRKWHDVSKKQVDDVEETPKYSIKGDLFGFTNMKDLNPLTVSEDELYERMMEEEKQDNLNISFSKDGEVQSGTLRALVRRLTSHLQELEFVDAFLYTYDIYIDHHTLLCSFILLYRLPLSSYDTIQKDDQTENTDGRVRSATYDTTSGHISNHIANERIKLVIQHRIINVIKRWIELRYSCLKSRRRFLHLFNEFCDYLSKSSVYDKKNQVKLLEVVKSTKKILKRSRRNLELAKPTTPRNFGREYKSVTEIPVVDLAQQLTLGDQHLFGTTKLSEYVSCNFSGPQKEKKSPTIMKSIERFNRTSYWVATCIMLANGTAKDRSKIISHFILLLDELRKLQNYNSMMQIYSALNMSCVLKLQKTWSYVSSKHKDILSNVNSLFDLNNKEYRSLLEIVESPCIPVQEIMLRDLTFIEENPTVFENGWINFTKLRYLGKAFKNLYRFQSLQYPFKSNDLIQSYLDSQLTLTENELYEKAKLIEENDKAKPEDLKKKRARMVKRSMSVADVKLRYQKK